MAEIEYSPTTLFTPPRWMGMLHSLTLMRATSRGSRSIMASAHSSFQPQSQTISVGDDVRLCLFSDFGFRISDFKPSLLTSVAAIELRWVARSIPSQINVLTSAITSAGARLPQRGQLAPCPCDQQFVKFSEPVIVKKPARPGTVRQIEATESVRYFCTSGLLVQSAAWSPSITPFISG